MIYEYKSIKTFVRLRGLLLLLLLALLPAHRAASSNEDAKRDCDYSTRYDTALELMAAPPADAGIQRHCCEALARQAVGKAARAIVEAGGAKAVAHTMRRFPQDVELQRGGCDVLGNLAEAGGSALQWARRARR